MDALMIRRGEWVVVCDGAKALVLENTGSATLPDLKTRAVYEQETLATHELGSDRPGRSHNPAGPGLSAVGQTDWHDQAEQEFLAALVKKLDAAVDAHEVKRIIVVAPPRALGIVIETDADDTPVSRGALAPGGPIFEAWLTACADGVDAAFVTSTDAADAAALAARGITELVHPDLTQDVPTYSSNNTVVD